MRTHPHKQTERRRWDEWKRQAEDRERSPAFSHWLNADSFNRIAHRLANLLPASTAEQDSANVMRVVILLLAYTPTDGTTETARCSLMKNGLMGSSPHSLATEWSPILGQSQAHLSEDQMIHRPVIVFNFKVECYYFVWHKCVFFVCHKSTQGFPPGQNMVVGRRSVN